MNKKHLKEMVCKAIDENRNEIIEIGHSILKNPELGFKEFKTSEIVKNTFDKLKIPYRDKLAITGVKGKLNGVKPGPCVAILGELDAVVCPNHKYADPITGAAHSCGHNMQIASMLGASFGLALSGAMKELSGEVALFAVPAEEFVEIEYRQGLRSDGKLSFLGGKQELILRGEFDDIDMAMMVHAQPETPEPYAVLNSTSSAFLGKTIVFSGREAHAGSSPHKGINALNAAMAALMCIHAQRETFLGSDEVRVHPIITKGGDLVNIVPADVRMETYVRGNTIEAVIDANKKVNRAIKGAAYAIGAEADICEIPGYLPLSQDITMSDLYKDNIIDFVGKKGIGDKGSVGGATDMGDISALMPSIHPYAGGFSGTGHSSDFTIVHEDSAYIYPAKAMAMTIIDLLYDDAKAAQSIINNFHPAFSKEQYISFWEETVKTSSADLS
jgi:amidohydrolase